MSPPAPMQADQHYVHAFLAWHADVTTVLLADVYTTDET